LPAACSRPAPRLPTAAVAAAAEWLATPRAPTPAASEPRPLKPWILTP
jgi:hypothetical protein